MKGVVPPLCHEISKNGPPIRDKGTKLRFRAKLWELAENDKYEHFLRILNKIIFEKQIKLNQQNCE